MSACQGSQTGPHFLMEFNLLVRQGRPLRGGVDRKRRMHRADFETQLPGRPLRGGVDRNLTIKCAMSMHVAHVAPYAGAWIETEVSRRALKRIRWVAPYAGAWIETNPV